MSDLLTMTDFSLWTRIGVTPEERAAEQEILVTIELPIDAARVAKTDTLRNAINYDDLAEDIRALGKAERKTIERLAEDLARMVLRKYKPAGVTITVKKFALPGARDVRLTIRRP